MMLTLIIKGVANLIWIDNREINGLTPLSSDEGTINCCLLSCFV